MIDRLNSLAEGWTDTFLAVPWELHALFLAAVWLAVVVTIARSRFFVPSTREPKFSDYATTAMTGVMGAFVIWVMSMSLPLVAAAALLIGALSFPVKIIYKLLS